MSAQNVISFHYTLTDPNGTQLDKSPEEHPLSFIAGAGQIIPGLEKVLTTLDAGAKQRISVPAAEAYGERDPKKIGQVQKSVLPTNGGELKIGDKFHTGPEPWAPVVVVTKIEDETVTLDANHPLAGVDLTFDVEVVSIREATEQEIAKSRACCHGDCNCDDGGCDCDSGHDCDCKH